VFCRGFLFWFRYGREEHSTYSTSGAKDCIYAFREREA
jgi:hypothetical protein